MQVKKYILWLLFSCGFINLHIYCQKPVFQSNKEFTHYFEWNNISINDIFHKKDLTIDKSFFKYFLTIESSIYQENNQYHLIVKTQKQKNDCSVRYRNFLISNAIFCDKLTGMVQLYVDNDIYKIYNIDIEYFEEENIVLDTTFFLSLDNVKNLEIRFLNLNLDFGNFSIKKMLEYKQLIDTYYQCDSLFLSYHSTLNQIDTTFTDRFPLYKFTLSDIEKKMKHIDNYKFEELLSHSNLDNRHFLQQRSHLLQKLNSLTLIINRKNEEIDHLFFEKALLYESIGDINQAIFYYHRTLDYNPTHCAAIENLNKIFIENHWFSENYKLWSKIKSRKINIDCEDYLLNIVFDSLYAFTDVFLNQANYYDALKMIDTIKLFCNITQHSSCQNRFLNIKTDAEQGIYMSYYDIISKSLRVKKYNLAETYCYGLANLMKEHKNEIDKQPNFITITEKIIENQDIEVHKLLSLKQYEKALNTIKNIIQFADSIGIVTSPDYEPIYPIIHTNIYAQKLLKIQAEKQKGHFSLAKTYEKDAEQYRTQYQKYIKDDFDEQKQITTIRSTNRYEEILNHINHYEITLGNYTLLDSFVELIQYVNIQTKNNINTPKFTNKLTLTVKYAFSKCNQLIWSADFERAKQLFNRVEMVVQSYNLDTNQEIIAKKEDFLGLLETRRRLYLEEEFRLAEIQAEKLIKKQNYSEAYRLLQKKQDELQKKDLYSQHIYNQTQRIKSPAIFQDSLQNVQILLNLKQFQEAFNLYEANLQFFKTEHLENFQLSCDSLSTFIQSKNKKEILFAGCQYFIEKKDWNNAFLLYFFMKQNKHLTSDNEVVKLANLFQQSFTDESILDKYKFDESDKLFLSNFCSKKKRNQLLKANK